LMQKAS